MSGDRRRVMLSWSSGKDSAWTLHELRRDPALDVVGLLTSFNAAADRVAMHAVRRELAERQAAAAGLPLIAVDLPWPCANADYEAAMQTAFDTAIRDLGVDAIAFGDLFLEDIRAYREQQLAELPLEPLFPIWQRPTEALATDMIDAGLKAVLTCVDPKQCPAEFAGREFDASLLDELPAAIDRCGENGEFHTFVYDGPMFAQPIPVRAGDIVERDGFVFADFEPAG